MTNNKSCMIDLRSDTVTRPTPEMRAAMASADVDDDVIGVDPTVDQLQRRIAELLGMETGLFVPSGSMSNQIAVRIHCKPGDEFLCEAGCHIYNYEQGAFAQLSGVVARTVPGEYGVVSVDQLRGLLRPQNEHLVRTRMITLENTHNRGAGRIQPYDTVVEICTWARAHGLRTHLDGARLFNAVAATGIPARDWAQHFDTVSVCFSKGLGAPVGSALVGSREAMSESRRYRKLFGGGMRQAGIIAAGALYALEHHRERLVDDHQHARILANGICQAEGVTLRPETIDTNMVIFRVDPRVGTAADLVTALREQGVAMLAVAADLVRAVTHLDVTEEDCIQAAAAVCDVAGKLSRGEINVRSTEVVY